MNVRSLIPALIWLLLLPFAGAEFLQLHWEAALIMFAALVLVPLGLKLLDVTFQTFYWLPIGFFVLAYLFFPKDFAVFLALPYLLLALWTTLKEGLDVLVYGKFTLLRCVRVFALAYWSVGAAFAGCFLAGLHPLGFDEVIVDLTAAHFHLAGFVLTVLIYSLLRINSTFTHRLLGWAALFGMPLVAAGIVSTKLGFSPILEWVSAIGFAGMAFGVVVSQVRLAFDKKYPIVVRQLWFAGAFCLLAGATLATLYGLRFLWPMAWINIPNMKIWHGTLNTVGFGWLTLMGWGANPLPLATPCASTSTTA